MKKYILFPELAALAIALVVSSCQDSWNSHYEKQVITSDSQVEIYDGSLKDFLVSQPGYSTQNKLFSDAGIYDRMQNGQQYLVVVYDNALLASSQYATNADFAKYCISDYAIAPPAMQDGMGVDTWHGKNLWISIEDGKGKINNQEISRCICTKDAYVYEIDGLLSIAPSIYEVIESLDDSEYSMFKNR